MWMVVDTGMVLSKLSLLNLSRVSLSFLLLSLVLSEEHPDREDHIHALVVVFVVVVPIRDADNALELVRVPGGYDDIVGVALAVPLDPREVPHGAEAYLVEDYGVVAAVIELCHLGALSQPDARI